MRSAFKPAVFVIQAGSHSRNDGQFREPFFACQTGGFIQQAGAQADMLRRAGLFLADREGLAVNVHLADEGRAR